MMINPTLDIIGIFFIGILFLALIQSILYTAGYKDRG